MRIYRNDQFIKKRANLGRYVSLFGLGVLLIGLIVSFTAPQLILVSFLCLIAGFIASQVGIYYGNRYARVDRPDDVLAKALKGFDDKYRLYQYTSPAANVLVTPGNCYVFAVKMVGGSITYRGGKWKHDVGWKRFFRAFTQESLGNPIDEAQVEVNALRRYLNKRLPDVEIPLSPVIVFGADNAEVNAGESPVPALHAKKLKDWLRGPGKGGPLSAAAREQLIGVLEPASMEPQLVPEEK
jgi:hypothetical protein